MARAPRHSPSSEAPNRRRASRRPAPARAARETEGRTPSRRSDAQLAARLGRDIVTGVFPPGSLLPSAAEMGARFSASRTALREAYSKLSGKGLIVARPRIGTRVRLKADWNLLDPEVLAWHLELRAGRAFRRRTVHPAPGDRAGGGGDRRDFADVRTASRASPTRSAVWSGSGTATATSSAPTSIFTSPFSRRRETIFSPRSAGSSRRRSNAAFASLGSARRASATTASNSIAAFSRRSARARRKLARARMVELLNDSLDDMRKFRESRSRATPPASRRRLAT